MNYFKVKVNKVWAKTKKRHQRRRSNKPLTENNSQDGYEYENPMANHAFNTAEEQRLFLTPDNGRSVQPDSRTQNSKQDISKVVCDSFPKPPAQLDQNLLPHLSDVNKTLSEMLALFAGEMKIYLISCCHDQMFAHLHNLLQNINSSTHCLQLMNWLSDTYLSQDMLGNPDQRLLDKWEAEAKVKLYESLKKEISEPLHKILQTHSSQKCHDEEMYIGLYVDVIQCFDGKLKCTQGISSSLCDEARKICFPELLQFVKRYAVEQNQLLSREVQNWKERNEKIETILFLKTLKTCTKLKEYAQFWVLKETEEVLENLETSTLNFLNEIMADIAERGVKTYFKSGKQNDLQLETLSTHFPILSYVSDEQKMVMNEAYRIFSHTYLEQLIKKRWFKLRLWISDDGSRIQCDAHYLHYIFSQLAHGVQPWNLILCKIPEVLASKDIEGLKLTVAKLQLDCCEDSVCSEDLRLLPALLRWKGLSKQKVREVLEALPSGPSPADCATEKTGSPFLCLCFCR